MSLVDSLLNVMHMNPDDDDDYYDDDYYDEEEEEPAPKRRRSQAKEPEEPVYKSSGSSNQPIDINSRSRDRAAAKPNSKVTPMRPSSRRTSSSGMEVCVIKPTSFDDAREITETLLMNRAVILNVEGLDVDIAQRIIDFSSGSCFAISGNLQKISNYIFIIAPPAVDVSGDFQSLFESYGQAPIRMDM